MTSTSAQIRTVEQTKLYGVLAGLDKYEQNRCRKYVQSPYFNRSEALEILYDELIRHINGKRKANVKKESIWKKMHTDREYDDVRFRKYVSDLLKLVEGYLCQEVFENQSLSKSNFLLQAISDHKLDPLIAGSLRTAGRLSEQAKKRSAHYYYERYAFENSRYQLLYQDRHGSERTNIDNISHSLDYFFMAEKFRIKCAALSRQYDEGDHDYELHFVDQLANHVAKNLSHYEEIAPVIIYYQIYRALSEADETSHYHKLKKYLDRHGLAFPREEGFWLYTFAINYCVRRINKGQSEFLREYFKLYQDLLAKKIIIIDNELAIGHFRNVVIVGLRLGEMSWTEEFIHEYQQYLPEQHRENAVSFNLAQLYFYKKEYDKVIQTLAFVEYEDLSYNLRSKTFLLMTYYETDEIEPLYSLMDSFRAYLSRHKEIPANRKKSYQDLIRIVKRMSRVLPGETKAIEKLENEIKDLKSMASYQWVKEKLNELK